ncbi:MAG: flavin reductase family protein [Bdellovibrionales bacterium]|nr:flavin reductase family protein [Bdellovibrionales bacterium]
MPAIPSSIRPWTSGQTLTLDPKTVGQIGMYKLLISGVVPRPIALLSTCSPDGIANLAPFSFFNAVSSNPPCLSVSITRKNNGDKKDSLRNIEATKQFVVNVTPSWIAEKMNQTSAEYPYGVNEFSESGLTPVQSSQVMPPRVAESPLAFECELFDQLEIGDGSQGSTTLVIGKILAVQVDENAIQDGKLLLEKLDPLSRLGGMNYGLTRQTFELARPTLGSENPT